MSQFFASGSQSIGASASAAVLPVNIQGWFPLRLTDLISLQSKGLSRVFSSLSAAAAAKSFQSCPILCDPIDGSPPGSPVPGILQARTLEWAAISFSNAWKWKVKVKSLSRVRLLATPWTAAYQAPLSMGFSRQEYWSGLPLPSPPAYLWGLKFHHVVASLSVMPVAGSSCPVAWGSRVQGTVLYARVRGMGWRDPRRSCPSVGSGIQGFRVRTGAGHSDSLWLAACLPIRVVRSRASFLRSDLIPLGPSWRET